MQAWGMEGAASDGNRGLSRGRPRRYAPLPPPTAAPSPPFPQPLANRLPAPLRARPPPTTLARLHTSHTPDGDAPYTLFGTGRDPAGVVTPQPLPSISLQASPASTAHAAALVSATTGCAASRSGKKGGSAAGGEPPSICDGHDALAGSWVTRAGSASMLRRDTRGYAPPFADLRSGFAPFASLLLPLALSARGD